MKNKFNDLINSMAAAGASAEDIAKTFTDALNAYTDKAKKEELRLAKQNDAAAIMKMVGAFLGKYYGDDHWTSAVCEDMAKEFVSMLDAADDMVKAIADIKTFKPVKGSCLTGNVKLPLKGDCDHELCTCKGDSNKAVITAKKSDVDSALSFFDEFIKSL